MIASLLISVACLGQFSGQLPASPGGPLIMSSPGLVGTEQYHPRFVETQVPFWLPGWTPALMQNRVYVSQTQNVVVSWSVMPSIAPLNGASAKPNQATIDGYLRAYLHYTGEGP